MSRNFSIITLLMLVFLTTGCAIVSRRVNDRVADSLTGGGGTVFSGDNDPEFIQDALPFGLKLYESLLESNPDHIGLLQTLASGHSSYSYLYLHFPADTLPADTDRQEHLRQRAKKHYLRARGYAIRALSLRYPDFMKRLSSAPKELLEQTTTEDADLLYWAGISWMGAFTVDQTDLKLALSSTNARKLLFRVKELAPNYGNGTIDEFLVTYYGSLPKKLGGNTDSAAYYFDRAVKLNDPPSAAPYIAYAKSVLATPEHEEEFVRLLKKAKDISPEEDPDNLLIRTVKQQEASWLLRNRERIITN
ncbi:MAG: TRAP transporter TatT component family protein [Fibrobacterota bacterium]